jgi:hypothetical protein
MGTHVGTHANSDARNSLNYRDFFNHIQYWWS